MGGFIVDFYRNYYDLIDVMIDNKQTNTDMTYIKIDSVGSVFMIETGYVYPQKRNGTPDFTVSNHISEISDEWFSMVSDEDLNNMLVASQKN